MQGEREHALLSQRIFPFLQFSDVLNDETCRGWPDADNHRVHRLIHSLHRPLLSAKTIATRLDLVSGKKLPKYQHLA